MVARTAERGRDGPTFSLIFPTYNPGSGIERTWHEVQRFLHGTSGSWEVLFVCDGCADGTQDRLTAWSAGEGERVRVLSYAPNRGKGYAVRYGLAAARGEWRVFTDVDLAYGFDDVQRLVAALHQGAEVAIASRLHPESQLIMPTWLQGYAYRRHLQSLAFSTVVRLILPLKQKDTQAGLKGLSARAAELLLPRLRADGFEFDCELLTACTRLKLEVVEIPVCVRYQDAASTTSARTGVGMLRRLWRIRRQWASVPALPALPSQTATETPAPDRQAA